MAVSSVVTSQLAELPLGKMLHSLAHGIAQAQVELDKATLRIAQIMAGTEDEDRVAFGERSYSLFELGLSPTFYFFTEATLEVKLSVSLTVEGGGRYGHSVQAVDLSFASKYQYSVEASSRVTTRIATLPAPTLFQDRLQAMVDGERWYRAELAKIEERKRKKTVQGARQR